MPHRRSAQTPATARWPYALSCVAALLWIPQAWLLARAVMVLLRWQQAAGAQAAPWGTITALAAAVAAIGLLRAALEYAASRATWRVARAQLTALRHEFGARLRSASPLDVRRPPSGQLASAWMEQAEAIVPWLANYTTAQWRVMVVAPVILVCVLWHSWAAALLLAVAAPFIPLFMALIGWRAQAVSEEQLAALGHLHAHLLERLRALPTLHALHAQSAAAQRLGEIGRTLAERTMRVLRIAMLSSAVLELFSALGVALVAVYVGFHLLGMANFGAWRGAMTLERGLFVLMLAPTFFDPLRELSAVWHDRADGLAAQRTLGNLLEGLAPMVTPEKAEAAAANDGNANDAPPAVELRGVRPLLAVLDDDDKGENAPQHPLLDISIPAGAHVAVTGASGSGKSLLLALVAGLAQASEGQVLIGGEVLDASNVARLRQRMGWQGQPPHFLAGSLARNLTLGGDAPPAEAAHEALRDAGLDDFIERMQELRLGEGGSGISGGEALRLALARLAASGHARLLLLDEPTAHLDTDSAALVRDAIRRMARGCTLLAATHDPELMAALPYELRIAADGSATLLQRDAAAQEENA
ncbi:MAG: thiol reductant ABC exporter subunit CydD [Ottowia sp.]|nr:thiol reductant ABC exporter subunit CydD [Ottowia sp.]